MESYADEQFYTEVYRAGLTPPISGPQFDFYSRIASKEIRGRTFGSIERSGGIPYEVKMCCCELAEKLSAYDSAKDENGRILQSYSNDGDSGSFQAVDQTTEGREKEIRQILRSWLLDTGLLFCGAVRKNEP